MRPLLQGAAVLILTRRIGETITIGSDIRVTVYAINGGQVRLGIEAPREVAVDREEIAVKKAREASSHD
jgi:carbon storage regulator